MRLSNFRTPKGALLNIYNKNGVIQTNLFGKLQVVNSQVVSNDLISILNDVKNNIVYVDPNNTNITNRTVIDSVENRLNALLIVEGVSGVVSVNYNVVASTNKKTSKQAPKQEQAQKEAIPVDDTLKFKMATLEKIEKFFNDFSIDVAKSNRFINTLHITSVFKGVEEAKKYISDYVRLIDHPDVEDIENKLNAIEVDDFIDDLRAIPVNKYINKRLEVLYGPAGTGKTTKAIIDHPNAKVIACHPDMSSEQLFQVVTFSETSTGDAQIKYNKSMLVEAMEKGEAVILDEINILPFEAQRTLQTITDNKSFIDTECFGRINIKEGFQIIGTMNLIVNGRIIPLSEPLVDRCSNIIKLELSAEELAKRCF